jgi:hypothetical protein
MVGGPVKPVAWHHFNAPALMSQSNQFRISDCGMGREECGKNYAAGTTPFDK